MLRNCSLEEISDGRLYDQTDMVKAYCNECKGCHACCEGMGNSIILDPLDVSRLTKETGKSFEALLADTIELNVVDGLILPNIKMVNGACTFLNAEGRCGIHAARPGFCRLFPLGRYYEDGGFKYFLQIHECDRAGKVKVKVSKWIDTPDLKNYEKFVNDWHYFLLDVQEVLYNAEDSDLIKNLNLFVVNRFYLKPYDQNQDFYIQFYERLKEGKDLLALA